MIASPIRLGISRCLLGDEVRYDGGHKCDTFLTDVLGRHVEWVPLCPEVEAGLGIPREPIRLLASAATLRVVAVKSGTDHTERMERFSRKRVRALEALQLSGYVFKKDSPSCGMSRVRVYKLHETAVRFGVGIFARTFMAHFPLVPIEEEGRLNDPVIRENFIERIFCYRRWQDFCLGRLSRRALIDFHTRHKLLLLSHSSERYDSLGRLVAEAKAYPMGELAHRYGHEFMNTLKIKSTVRKHVNVLHHVIGYFKRQLDKNSKRELLSVIGDYHHGHVPLIVPLTLINHYVRLFEIPYLHDQVYLTPHPKELMLRYHV